MDGIRSEVDGWCWCGLIGCRDHPREEIRCAGLHKGFLSSSGVVMSCRYWAVIPWASSHDCVEFGWLVRINKCPSELVKISYLNFFLIYPLTNPSDGLSWTHDNQNQNRIGRGQSRSLSQHKTFHRWIHGRNYLRFGIFNSFSCWVHSLEALLWVSLYFMFVTNP